MKAARAYGTNRRTNIIFTEKTTQWYTEMCIHIRSVINYHIWIKIKLTWLLLAVNLKSPTRQTVVTDLPYNILISPSIFLLKLTSNPGDVILNLLDEIDHFIFPSVIEAYKSHHWLIYSIGRNHIQFSLISFMTY
jgi:hypothetical protein